LNELTIYLYLGERLNVRAKRVREGVINTNFSYDSNEGIDKGNCKLKYITALLLVRPLSVQ